MKKLLLAFIFLSSISVIAQTEFITTWKTDNPGTSNSTSITIPTFSGETYSYDVDWDNDGNFDDFGVTGDITHDFGAAGTYTIRIKGTFPRIYFNFGGDRQKIISIDQWGTIAWSSMESAFAGASNLMGNASDVPNLTGVTSMSQMFLEAFVFNQDISTWDTITVTDMSRMFDTASAFNQDISAWDTSSVTNMFRMFGNAVAFNQDISAWDTSLVVDMSFMFFSAISFNQDLSWNNTSSVTNTSGMFFNATSFNQDISAWDTSLVTDMSSMFYAASVFNQNISSWDTSSVTSMFQMFRDAVVFDQDLGTWNVENVSDFTDMFDGATLSNANYDGLLIGWDAQNLQANSIFSGGNSMYCAGFAERANMIASDGWTITDAGQSCPDYFVTSWKTDNAGTSNATSITIPTHSGSTFSYDVDWNNDGAFDDFGVTGDITHDYGTTGTYTVAIKGVFPRIFINFGGDRLKIISIEQWGTNAWTSMNSAFAGASNLIGNATDTPDLSGVSSMFAMFVNASIFNQDIGNWDTSNVTDMSFMFNAATAFNQDISGWNTLLVIRMDQMFKGTTTFNQDISTWDTSAVIRMDFMFQNATAFDQNIGSWNVENVSNFTGMFDGATLSNGNYDALLIGWDAQNLVSSMNFNAGNSQYCTPAAIAARANMIASDGWTITDGGQFTGTCTLGVNDFELKNPISLYPNPSSSIIIINGLTEKSTVTIFNITGKLVYEIENYENNTEIKTNDLTTGLYIVNVKNNSGNSSLKWIKE